MAKKEPHDQREEIQLPQSIIDSFARFLVPEIRKFYESAQGQREFAAWEARFRNGAGGTAARSNPRQAFC